MMDPGFKFDFSKLSDVIEKISTHKSFLITLVSLAFATAWACRGCCDMVARIAVEEAKADAIKYQTKYNYLKESDKVFWNRSR